MPYTSDQHTKAVAKIQRDELGRFHKKSQPSSPPSPPPPDHNQNVFTRFLKSEAALKKTKDDNKFIEIYNPFLPLIRIFSEMKRQKAFYLHFTASLGITGVVVVLGSVGIFGTIYNPFCDKGLQSHAGTIQVLSFKEQPPKPSLLAQGIQFLSFGIVPAASNNQPPYVQRVVLKSPEATIHLVHQEPRILILNNQSVIATGNFDACSKTLTIHDQTAIEIYPKP